MKIATANLSNYRQAPRKVGLVAGLIRGKRLDQALIALETLPKRASLPMAKLVRSAVSNARAKGMNTDVLVISRIEVGKGIVFRRIMPRARGRGATIRHKTSNIRLVLSERPRQGKMNNKQRTTGKKNGASEAKSVRSSLVKYHE